VSQVDAPDTSPYRDWIAAGEDVQTALQWQPVCDYDEATRWKEIGYTPEQAAPWVRYQASVDPALKWWAQDCAQAGYTISQVDQWLSRYRCGSYAFPSPFLYHDAAAAWIHAGF